MLNAKGYEMIPAETIEAIRRYVDQRSEPGDFLSAVLNNDLKEACAYATEIHRNVLFYIVQFCYWEIPSVCWGSRAKVVAWLDGRRAPGAVPVAAHAADEGAGNG